MGHPLKIKPYYNWTWMDHLFFSLDGIHGSSTQDELMNPSYNSGWMDHLLFILEGIHDSSTKYEAIFYLGMDGSLIFQFRWD